MRWIGFILTAAACLGIGQWAALQMSRRVRQLEACISLTEFFKAQLAFTMAEPVSILQEAVSRRVAKNLSFLSSCLDLYEQGEIFPEAWKKSLQQERGDALTNEDRQILLDLGEVLGSTALQGQLDQLNLLESRFQIQQEAAAQRYQTTGKLYQSLGLMCGLALVILLW